MKYLHSFILFLSLQTNLITGCVYAQDTADVSDSIATIGFANKGSRFPYRTVISAGMVTYGILAVNDRGLRSVNKDIINIVGKPDRSGTFPIDNFLPAVPLIATYALKVAGVRGENSLGDALFIGGIAFLIGNGVATATKSLHLEIRPDGSNDRSFPSAHTVNGFIAAELLRKEYHDQPWYGVAGYTLAAATGVLRMYNRKHWFSDVVAGAGIGILSTQAAYQLYPLVKRLNKQTNNHAFILPVITGKSIGFYYAATLK